ncbi:MAG: cupin domain-containing protein [Chitinophagaceae bacterium]|nr:cupin domain-containing protein [Rubrivivax sp.]
MSARAAELIGLLKLAPHPEGGFYRELFRSPHMIEPRDGRALRPALTSIDFVLTRGQCSAWHRVLSDEVWHLLEGGPLRLWLLSPALDSVNHIELQAASAAHAPRHVVPAGWWQAAEPLGDFAYCGASVGPGFDFADFAFGRDHADLRAALTRLAPDSLRLL